MKLDRIYPYQIGIITLFVSVVCFVYMYWGVGYTTNDETRFEIWALERINSYFSLSTILHIVQGNHGRVQMMFWFYSLTFPHWLTALLDYRINFFNLLNIISIFTNIILFSISLYKVTREKYLPLTTAIFFIAAIQNSWSHNAVTSYTFFVNFSISLLLLSFILLFDFLSSDKKRFLISSSLLFLFALFFSYEFFLFYTAIPILIIFSSKKNKIYNLIPYFSSVCIFLSAYFFYRKYHPSDYIGFKVGEISLSKIFSVIYQYTVSSFPTYNYFHNYQLFRKYSGVTAYSDYFVFLQNLEPIWIVKAMLISYYIYNVLYNNLINISSKIFIGFFFVSIYIMLIPNIILSIVERHQRWVANGELSYVMTYFSYFGTVLLISNVILFVNQMCCKNAILKRFHLVYIAIIFVLSFMTSLLTDYSNYFFFKEQKMSQQKWKILDDLVKSATLNNIPSGSFVYAPSLWQHKAIVANHPTYWTDYMRLKYKKEIILSGNAEEFNKKISDKTSNVYYIKYSQQYSEPYQFILFSKIDLGNSNRFNLLLSQEAVLISNFNCRQNLIFGRSLSTNNNSREINIDDSTSLYRDGNFFSTHTEKKWIKNSYSSIHIKTNGMELLDLESISMSLYIDHKLDSVRNNVNFPMSNHF